jgi:myosin V
MAHNYDVGTKAWQPDVTEGWVASEVVSKTERDGKVKLVFQLANGEVWSKIVSTYYKKPFIDFA